MAGSPAATSGELLRAEDAGWAEVRSAMDSLSPEQAALPGYYPEGWSAKDAVAHLGSWLAEAGVVLEQIREGTFRPSEIDIDAMNRRFLEAMKDVPWHDVRTQAISARARMLVAWEQLGDLTPDAAFWIRKSGADHYAQHLPRLREWISTLGSGTSG